MLDNILIPLISALIGGGGTWFGVSKTIKSNNEQEQIKDKKFILSVLKAIKSEIDATLQVYSERIGQNIEAIEENNEFPVRYTIISDYFTVFNSNACYLGKIENDLLRDSLIQHYILIKLLLDNLVSNNDLLSLIPDPSRGSVSGSRRSEEISSNLRLVATTIKTFHKKIKNSFCQTSQQLKEEIDRIARNIDTLKK